MTNRAPAAHSAMKIHLQHMVDDVQRGLLPEAWTTFDFESFSAGKRLWDYQQRALRRAATALWKYYEDCADYRRGEAAEANYKRKQKLLRWYEDNGLDARPLALPVAAKGVARLLPEFYDEESLAESFRADAPDRLSFAHFANRMSFWMATGSGKTLVLVKLIEMLDTLVRRGEIPPRDILVLAHKDELLQQFAAHVAEFNAAHRGSLHLRLRSLRDYAAAKRDTPDLFADGGLTVFTYRSDNLSDEQKERIVDFRNYEAGGGWYVLLDEAHKGNKEDSKRQHIYSILSRRGFLFNFSATFTEESDLAATVSNFNLSEFVRSGFGKHIALLKQEIRAFRDEEDFTGAEKQKIVLKSLLLLAYVKGVAERVRAVDAKLYHEPLLVVFVNSVNTEDADLKLFFRELERIAGGKVGADALRQAKDELWAELRGRPAYVFEEEDGRRVDLDEGVFAALTLADVLRRVFNADSTGSIELCERPSNRNELALKTKVSDKPFALIKVGDTTRLRNEELAGYEFDTRFEEEGYFESLNARDSSINILLGSRTFYEGWDSNRPNVLNFVNIGTSADAKKFVTQAVGRGVRIEPLKDQKRQLRCLANANAFDAALFRQIKDEIAPLESLFILGTNREALNVVLGELNQQKPDREERALSVAVSDELSNRELLIPAYRLASEPHYLRRDAAKFPAAEREIALLGRYVEWVGDDRVLLALHDAGPRDLKSLRDSLERRDDFFRTDGNDHHSLPLLVRRVTEFFNITPEEFDCLKPVGDEISHFRHITVKLAYFDELQEKADRVIAHRDFESHKAELGEKFRREEITLDEFSAAIRSASAEENFEGGGHKLRLRHSANHFYVPLILSGSEKVDYIKHIIKTPSEVSFLDDLEAYLARPDNKFKEFDWWLFSRLDQTRDRVYIPYYAKENRIAYFYPDFIFWMAKGDDYSILFVDPKGTAYSDYQQKVDGFTQLFAEKAAGDPSKVFRRGRLKVRFHLSLYTADSAAVGEKYRHFWVDRVEKCVDRVLSSGSQGPVSN